MNSIIPQSNKNSQSSQSSQLSSKQYFQSETTIQETISTDSIQKPYTRKLILQERQAFQGAKTFYYGVLPTTIVILIFFTAFLYEQSNENLRHKILPISISIGLTIISYIIAIYFYIQCSKIQTYPAPHSKQEITELLTQTTLSNLEPSLHDNQNLQLHPSPNSSFNKPSRHYCSHCEKYCQYRTRHCYKCQVCIQRYDHHCFWIGNCVGKHNHKQFYIFLLVQSFNNWAEMRAIMQVRDYAYGLQFDLRLIVWVAIYGMLLLSIGFLCFTGYLAIYHTMLITLSLTTWQQMRRQKIEYLKYLPKGYNPFSIGWTNNLKKFFTEETRAAKQDCVLQNFQKYLPNYEEAKVIKPGFNFIDNQYYSCC